jgi:hypothetical protein
MASRRLFATAALALLAPAMAVRSPSPTAAGVPRVVLWAWERPDDLRNLPSGVGVAFLAQTIDVGDGTHVLMRRRQALRVDDGTPMIAVTRIEAPGDASGADETAVARAIADTARLPMVSAVQIDFDAKRSQRSWYRRLLFAVRRALPPEMPLSMTALASWCLDDDWLDELPVDEAVPMLFRMGPEQAAIGREWPRRQPAPRCRGSVGISLDEQRIAAGSVRRTYVFNPAAWTRDSIAAAMEAVP